MNREFVEYLEDLTASQRAFILARLRVETDKEAAELAGITPRTVRNWKSGDDPFVVAYECAMETTTLNQIEQGLVILPPEIIERIMAEQESAVAGFLPRGVQRLMDIVLNGGDREAIAAMRLLADRFHLDTAERLDDIPALTNIQKRMLLWNQVGANAEERRALAQLREEMGPPGFGERPESDYNQSTTA